MMSNASERKLCRERLSPVDASEHATEHADSEANSFSQETPPSSQAKVLIEALQNYVVPLIQTSIEENEKSPEIRQAPISSPEAVKFLTALHELISSMILQSQIRKFDKIEVDLEDINSLIGLDYLQEASHWLWIPETQTIDPLDYLEGVDWMWTIAEPPRYLQRLQAALREHVFSMMPIRVLHFDQSHHESKLQITLLDRNGIYSNLATRLEDEYSEQAFQEEVAKCGGPDSARAEELAIAKWVSSYSKYAILSHTWLRGVEGEVTYGMWHMGHFNAEQPGYQKLANFCKAAWNNYGLVFGWIDTLCINKESSSELDESIRSMYKWYKNADVCITYLAKTYFLSGMHDDPWFTRGWTFQELIAPQNIKFYNADWKQLIYSSSSDKNDDNILNEIRKATTITYSELCNPQDMPISRRMQLAAKREVMREEDTAYSLMGICDVSISIAYGEGGKRAFFRLMMEILTSSNHVLDVFNCTLPNLATPESAPQYISHLIPWGPSAYSQRSPEFQGLAQQRLIKPMILTHLGLRISVLLMPSLGEDDPDFKNEPIGDYYATVSLVKLDKAGLEERQTFHLLDKGLGICPTQDGSTWTTTDCSSNDSDYHSASDTMGDREDREIGPQVHWTDIDNDANLEVQVSWNDRSGTWERESHIPSPDNSSDSHSTGHYTSWAATTFGILTVGGDKTNIDVPNICLAIGFLSHWSVKWESTSTYISIHDTHKPIVFELKKRDTNSSDNSAGYSIKRNELAKHGMKLVTMYL